MCQTIYKTGSVLEVYKMLPSLYIVYISVIVAFAWAGFYIELAVAS